MFAGIWGEGCRRDTAKCNAVIYSGAVEHQELRLWLEGENCGGIGELD